MVRLANTVCEGRLISVLEGGYEVHGGCISPLALSVRSQVESLTSHGYEKVESDRWAKEVCR